MAEQRNRGGILADMQMDDYATIDLMEIFTKLIAAWKMIVCSALILAALAGVYTKYFVTPLYKANSVIYVVSNRDSVVNVSDLQIGTALTHDYIEIFRMWEVHEAVIENLGLSYSHGTIASMVSVTNVEDTRMLDIKVTSASPQEAADIANEYANVTSQFIADKMVTDVPTIVSQARPPKSPSSPNLMRNVVVMGMLGGLIACAYVIICYMMDDKYKSAEDIRKYTGWTMLSMIPMEQNDNKKNSRRSA